MKPVWATYNEYIVKLDDVAVVRLSMPCSMNVLEDFGFVALNGFVRSFAYLRDTYLLFVRPMS